MSIYYWPGTKQIDSVEKATIFLHHFGEAQKQMKLASDAMLAFKATMTDKDAIKRYDRTHKQLVRLSRDWNCIEHHREPKWEDGKPVPDDVIPDHQNDH